MSDAPHVRERKKLVAEARKLAARLYAAAEPSQDEVKAIYERLKEIDGLVYGELA